MKSVRGTKSVAAILACAAFGALVRPVMAADMPKSIGATPMDVSPTSQPTAPAASRSVQEIVQEFQAVSKELTTMLPPKVMSDSIARNDAAPKAIPIAYQRLALIEELGATKKIPPATIANLKQSNQSLLYLLNDTPTVTKVKGMIDSTDPTRQIEGKSIDISARWMATGEDKAAAGGIVDEVEKLDKANPDNSKLTMMTLNLAQTSSTPELKNRLLSLVTDVMTDPYAKRLAAQITAQKEAEAKQAAMLNKPFNITGKTVEGKDFTTADWKGKVVLVDFWATWCGPCKAGLPHVKDIYNQYHDKGLELVGVSNDYDAKDLEDFTPKNNMPWPQLFDPNAAADHQWNPITLNNGIHGIPTMFLIDKKGILRSITARQDMDDLIPKLLAE
jgi:thiol-disulfide isomerase/thioredoxin